MPYVSKDQRDWLRINRPDIAARWDKKYGTKVVPGKKGRKRKKERK